MIKREALKAIYEAGNLLLGEAEGKMYLFRGRDPQPFRLSVVPLPYHFSRTNRRRKS